MHAALDCARNSPGVTPRSRRHSRLTVDATLDLEPAGDGPTRVRIAGAYEVSGKVAAMGPGTINKKAEKILDEFFVPAGEALGVKGEAA